LYLLSNLIHIILGDELGGGTLENPKVKRPLIFVQFKGVSFTLILQI